MKAILLRRGKDTEWLAEKAGATRTHISFLINNRRTASADMANRIASALKPVAWDDLFKIQECTTGAE